MTFRTYVLTFVALPAADVSRLRDYVLGKQIEILNNAFRDAGLVFDIAATSRTVNRDWWQHLTVEGNLQYTMKYETRRGGVSDLNVWIVGTIIDNAGQEVGGHGTLPQYYASHPDDDGVIIQEGTLPGGYMQNFNEGVVRDILPYSDPPRILTNYVYPYRIWSTRLAIGSDSTTHSRAAVLRPATTSTTLLPRRGRRLVPAPSGRIPALKWESTLSTTTWTTPRIGSFSLIGPASRSHHICG